MKKFKFYALAFAAIAFAGCSDDVIDGQGANGAQGDGTPAYLTISFSANSGNSSRSTADDANNNGDEHSTQTPGTGEDSGHHSEGITGESAIERILLVVAPVSTGSNAAGIAKIYTALDTEDEGYNTADEDDFIQTAEATKTYKNAEPIELATGDYNVLVVINPTDELLGTDNANLSNPTTLYNTIINGQYSYTAVSGYDDNYTNAANSIGMGLAFSGENHPTTDAAFIMANKAEAPVTLTQYNTSDNPATVNIDVERVLSKITFRSTTPTDGAENVYPVKVNIGSAPAITMEGAIAIEGQEGQYDIKTLNKGFDLKNQEVWGEYDTNGKLTAAYKIEYEQDEPKKVTVNSKEYTLLSKIEIITQAGYDEVTEESKQESDYCFVTNTDNPTIELEYDTDAEVETRDWFVKIEGYALVNLSKSVNYVRHTVTGGAMVPFGVLNGSNYLWTPNWDAKNGITFVEDENGDLQFPTGVTPGNWFYNTLADVSDESASMEISNSGGQTTFSIDGGTVQYFKPLSTLITDNSDVTGTDHYTGQTDNTPAVGSLMSYCFENSTDIEHQTHGLSTGISFVATIWSNKECTTPISKLYLYEGHNYTSIQQIKDAYGNNILSGLDEDSSKEELEAAGVKLYNSNICYYYTTEIKHYDNNDDAVLGNMEFAIMRNNIYSLSVSTITQIGDPNLFIVCINDYTNR